METRNSGALINLTNLFKKTFEALGARDSDDEGSKSLGMEYQRLMNESSTLLPGDKEIVRKRCNNISIAVNC
ncbi:hypothetical protein WN51_06403 [Melipona quadrifasciata]|uniref:Uncharacterized protein n=1 Tax=Melipona quadrifasciata TaxID=166423 RepID=A0A0N0BK68_9HYME|nr:hypothetical protein WN51_06403 [Melipona quadrifasciata]